MPRRKRTRYNFPKINLPGLNLPKVDLPQVNLPQVKLPNVKVPVRQMLMAVFLVAMGLAMVSLNGRLREFSRVTGERDALASEVAVMRVTSQGLETRLAYAQSDKAAEQKAREGHQVREGEIRIVAVTPVGEQAIRDGAQTAEGDKPVQKWEVWWALFFGQPGQ